MSTRPLVSVVMATYQRRHLLERSLECYRRHDFDNTVLELVVIDDHSTDGTRELVLDWSKTTGVKVTYLIPSPKNTAWRDCGANLNYGIRASAGDYILLTHPEVMPGVKSVRRCVEKLQGFEKEWSKSPGPRSSDNRYGNFGLYACCRVYYLSPREQELLDTVRWQEKGVLAVRDIEGFYELDTNGAPDFSHRATDRVAQPGSDLPVWESWVFGGFSRETLKRMGGLTESTQWGSVDIALTARRKTLGIPNHTCPEDQTIVAHQNHDSPNDVKTDRDMQKWVDELRSVPLTDATKMRYPACDFLGWS